MNDIKLYVQNISKFFGINAVIKDVSFTVYSGEFLSILGSSGCGKTTILRLLAGLTEPTSGQVFKDGVNITDLPPAKRGLGVVFQNFALFENMTALQNVEYALKVNKATKWKAREQALELLELVGLSGHVDKKPYKLSGGQQQRVAIARTLALKPDVILLDEPMSALDADTRLALRQELKHLQKQFGSTMIYITHDQEEAFALSDRIMVMRQGCIQQLDTPRNLIDHPANAYVERFVLQNIQTKLDSLIRYAR